MRRGKSLRSREAIIKKSCNLHNKSIKIILFFSPKIVSILSLLFITPQIAFRTAINRSISTRMKQTKRALTETTTNTIQQLPPDASNSGINMKRVRVLTKHAYIIPGNCVVYYMIREQRVHDNYSMLYAKELANQNNVPLKVVFNLIPSYLEATIRQYDFMLKVTYSV